MADVDIIGGSAAGLFAAYLLAREGKQVRLFDANDIFNVESRTLITTQRLTEILGFFPDEAIVNRIDRIDLFSPGRAVSIPMHEPDLVVERATVVRLLARKAIAAGVEIRGGCRLVDLRPGNKSLTIAIRDTHRACTEEFKTRILVGADGMSSRVAKTISANGHPTTPLLQAIAELPKGASCGTTQVWFEPDDTPYFYWLIPQSPGHAAVGLIAEEGKSARQKLERFLGRMALKPVEFQSARIPAYTHFMPGWRRFAGSDVYLVGDAAAQVKVTTVGGLVTGLRGAKIAASAILGRSNYFQQAAALRQELSVHLVIRNLLNRFGGADYDRMLDLLNPKTIRLLGRYNRDRATGVICRLMLAQPRFLKFAPFVSRTVWKNLTDNAVNVLLQRRNRRAQV